MTIKEWLETIEDKEVREKALRNCTNPAILQTSVKDAIFRAFNWKRAPEGDEFWFDIWNTF